MSDGAGGRGAFVVGAGILISRVIGLLRNTAFAYYFGAGTASDAYNAAFKIPNAVRNLLGEGTLSAAFVPVYSRLLGRGDAAAARALANAVLGLLLTAGSLLLSGRFEVERRIVIAAPAERVFEQVADPRRWKDWSVWTRRDPAMQIRYEGPPSGAGAAYSGWSGRSS